MSIFNDPRFQTLPDEQYEKDLEKANEEVSMMFDNVHIPKEIDHDSHINLV